MEEPLLAPTGVDYEGVRTIQDYCHQQARARGFHEEPDRMKELIVSLRETDPKLANYISSMYLGNRLMLIVGEASEAHEEIRAGRPVDETYYGTDAHGQLIFPGSPYIREGVIPKPEGVPSELADIFIRLMDYSQELGIDIAAIVKEKLEYNSTREYLHGKKF